MDAVTGITARVAQIQSQLIALAGRPAVGTVASSAVRQNSFASVYAQAVAATGTDAAPNVTAGRLNAAGVPADLAVYGNGAIPPNALRTVGRTGHRLWAPAAASLETLIAAARRDGVQIGITDSYRSYQEQVSLANRKGLYSQGGLAAKPGTSNHGWGLSVDLNLNAEAQSWMRTHAARYGFVADTPREPWHWTFTGRS